MSITIVQKSDLAQPKPDARRALVLAGGAISGGAFKVGGLLALNRFLKNLTVTDFDIYMGISAGAFLAAPLSAGVEPRELLAAIRGSSERLTTFRPADFYHPNWAEFVEAPARLARDLLLLGPRATRGLLRVMPRRREIGARCRAFLKEPGIESAERLIEIFGDGLKPASLGLSGDYLPAGLFDNRRIETYTRYNLERNDVPNDFRQHKLRTGKSLYIGATDLNTAQGVVFGHDEDTSVTISEAVQASTAIPLFFRPARVGRKGAEREYVDAAVRKTANISTAVRHGAQLVVCYNPFRPFVNYEYRPGSSSRRSLGEQGMAVIVNQAFRTLLHSRLRLGIEKLRLDTSFRGDVILIEPEETDARFFSINPLAFWRRSQATEHGYQSVKRSLEQHHETLRKVLGAYGIEVDLDGVQDQMEAIQVAQTPQEKLDAMGKDGERRRGGLRLVAGGQ